MSEIVQEKKVNLTVYNYINAAITIIIITAIVQSLIYAFNIGYNSYFGIPWFLTTNSPFGILKNIPFICKIILSICLIIIIVSVIIKLLKYLFPYICKFKFITFISSLLTFLLLIFLLIEYFKYHSLLILLNALIFAIFTIYFSNIFFKLYRLEHSTKKFSQDVSQNQLTELIVTNFVKNQKKNIAEVEEQIHIFPSLKTTNFIMGCIAIFLILFTSTLFWGIQSAHIQEQYYFISEDQIAISVYDSYIIAVSVNKDNDSGKYLCTQKYSLIPMNNVEMTLVETGSLISDIDQAAAVMFNWENKISI